MYVKINHSIDQNVCNISLTQGCSAGAGNPPGSPPPLSFLSGLSLRFIRFTYTKHTYITTLAQYSLVRTL